MKDLCQLEAEYHKELEILKQMLENSYNTDKQGEKYVTIEIPIYRDVWRSNKNEKRWAQLTLNSVCDGIGDGLHGTPEYDDSGDFISLMGTT